MFLAIYAVVFVVSAVALVTVHLWLVVPRGLDGFALPLMEFVKPAAMALFTLLGVLSRSVYDRLDATDKKPVRPLTLFKQAYRTASFWRAIIMSPLALMALYQTIAQVGSVALVCLLAYQNGFFFRAILAGRSETHAGDHDSKGTAESIVASR